MKREGKNVVGTRVAQARRRAGLTQADLSKRLGRKGVRIGRAGIAKLENSMRQVADFEVVGLARVLAVTPSWLLHWEG